MTAAGLPSRRTISGTFSCPFLSYFYLAYAPEILNYPTLATGKLTSRQKDQKAPVARLACSSILTLLGSPYRNDGPSLQMVPLLGRSLVSPGWACQFRAAEVSVARKCTGAVEKGSGEVEGKTDCIFNLLHSIGG